MSDKQTPEAPEASEITKASELTEEAKKLIKKEIKSVEDQKDGFFTVTYTMVGKDEDIVLKDVYKYKPKQDSTRDLLSLAFPVDEDGFVFLPKDYPKDSKIAENPRNAMFLLDTQSFKELEGMPDEKKKEIYEEMPDNYYPDVSPCKPANLCQETDKKSGLKWLWILLGILGVGLVVFLVYYFLVRRRTTFI